jgi:photosystem II stability/assembly factor-like uncharacterized protein
MKRYALLCSLLVLINIQLLAQLEWLNPQPSGYINTKIFFINDTSGYLMNSNGDLFMTSDKGLTWRFASNFYNAETFTIHDSTGIISTFDGSIYLSYDNGKNWQKKDNSPASNLENWANIIGRDTIFVMKGGVQSSISQLYKSVDRGNSWQLVNNNMNQFQIKNINFVTASTGYAVRADGIYKTTDGGVSWVNIYSVSTSATVISLKFFNTQTGYAYRQIHGMMKTTDGGNTWTVSPFPFNVNDIFFIDLNNAFAVGDDGIIYKTNDAGVTWSILNSPYSILDEYDLYTQYFFNSTTGIVAGSRGRMSRTLNAGVTWTNLSPTYTNTTAISFPADSVAYFTTWNNVYKTINAGRSWDSLPLSAGTAIPSNSWYEQCRFINKDTGFVTARLPARFYKTTNGGQNWILFQPTALAYDNITSMSFISTDTGYMIQRSVTGGVGSNKGLFKTLNGGNSWQEIGISQDFDKVYFKNDQVGYAIRYDKIFKTVNGGNTWAQLTTFDFVPLYSLWFINPLKGFITGRQGYMNMTTDGGTTWNHIVVDPQLTDLIAIKFYNDTIGYIMGNAGQIFKTTDGGLHWKMKGNIAYHQSPYIEFCRDTTVVFGGKYGSVVRTSIAEYAIDSVKAVPALCGAGFSCIVRSFMSPVDSIIFEYGTNYIRSVAGSPVRVKDSTVRSTATVSNLSIDSVYQMRVKILFRGKYYYSQWINFKSITPAKPVITVSGNTLTSSSVSGNQWYLNGVLIPGATGQQYSATIAGIYTVLVNQAGCSSAFSDGYNLLITAVPNVSVSDGGIRIYPNPVFYNKFIIEIKNYRVVNLIMFDIHGKSVLQKSLIDGINHISVPTLESGMYILKFNDKKSNEEMVAKILKL